MIMIFQLSDWFPKPIILAIIVKFDQIRKNWWRISCAEILDVGKNCFVASSVKKMSRFEEVSPEKIKRIAWKFTKTARPRRITVNYYWKFLVLEPSSSYYKTHWKRKRKKRYILIFVTNNVFILQMDPYCLWQHYRWHLQETGKRSQYYLCVQTL